MRLLLVAAALFCAAGCLDVDSQDGTLICNQMVPGRPCPSGFYCLQPNNTCWRLGHYPRDMAEPINIVPPGGGGGEDMSVPVEEDMAQSPQSD
jgi:hypothetical protein